MRLLGAVVMIAGMVWMTVGCGGAIAPLMGGMVKGGVVLADSVTQIRYSLSVADGSAALTAESGPATVASEPDLEPELVDGVTGARYSLRVVSGALMLAPDASSAPGLTQIGLTDTLNAKTYELAVESGALTLTANDGGKQ